MKYYYSELSGEEQRLFDRMQANQGRAFHTETCIEGLVRYQDQYHVVEKWKTIRWTNPMTLLSTAGFLGGGVVIAYVGKREISASPW